MNDLIVLIAAVVAIILLQLPGKERKEEEGRQF